MARVCRASKRTRFRSDTPTHMMSHATTERRSSHQSTSGMGGGARAEGLLIKPTVSLLAAPSSVVNLVCFGGHQSNGRFVYHLEAVSSRSHEVLLSFVKKLRQEIYGKSDWLLTGFFTIWEGPHESNNQTLRPIRNGTATSAAHCVVSLSSIWIVTSLHASVGLTDARKSRARCFGVSDRRAQEESKVTRGAAQLRPARLTAGSIPQRGLTGLAL